MRPTHPTTWFASLFAVAAAADPLYAQSTVAAAKDSVIEISPFVVNSTKDTGYRASTTLAGTRINTDVKDIGASISIYTKEFIDDIGAINPNDLLIYATGMEAGGPGGNLANATSGDLNGETASPRGTREDPQGVTRARGLASPTRTRDFSTLSSTQIPTTPNG